MPTVLDRLAAFLPQMEAANAQLQSQAQHDPSSVHVELPDEDEDAANGEYIEMVRWRCVAFIPDLGPVLLLLSSPLCFTLSFRDGETCRRPTSVAR